MVKLNFQDLNPNKKDKHECKGIFFRYTKSSFISSYNSIEFRESYRILKRLSCLHCRIYDFFIEDISNYSFDELQMVYPDNPVHYEIYQLTLKDGTFDYWGDYNEDHEWSLDLFKPE